MSLPETDVEKNKTALIPDEKSHGLGVRRARIMAKKEYRLFPTFFFSAR